MTSTEERLTGQPPRRGARRSRDRGRQPRHVRDAQRRLRPGREGNRQPVGHEPDRRYTYLTQPHD